MEVLILGHWSLYTTSNLASLLCLPGVPRVPTYPYPCPSHLPPFPRWFSLRSASLSQLVQPQACLMAQAHIPGHWPCPPDAAHSDNSLPESQQLRRGLHHLQLEAGPQPGDQLLPGGEPVADISESSKLDLSKTGRKGGGGWGGGSLPNGAA